jgi:hypothetical protein
MQKIKTSTGVGIFLAAILGSALVPLVFPVWLEWMTPNCKLDYLNGWNVVGLWVFGTLSPIALWLCATTLASRWIPVLFSVWVCVGALTSLILRYVYLTLRYTNAFGFSELMRFLSVGTVAIPIATIGAVFLARSFISGRNQS